jgi:fluoride ion exporter CrcB/FEX
MVVRRKKRSARRKRTFSINLIETGAGLAFLDAADAGKAARQAIGPEGPAAALTTLSSAFKLNKDKMVRIGAGALAAKLVVGSLGGSKILGAIGPLKLRA